MAGRRSGGGPRPKDLNDNAELENKRFKYQSFNARIARINVGDIVRSAPLLADDLSERECFFNIKLNDWRELNLTAPFVRFAREAGPLVQTLPLLLFHRDRVVDLLIEGLTGPDYLLAAEPLLDLIGVMAQDLQDEAYAVMPRIFAVICPLLDVPESEVVECVFACITHCFKFLGRLFSANSISTFDLLAPLLGSKSSAYVRHFAAESFAYLVRRVRAGDLPALARHMVEGAHATDDEAMRTSVSFVWFETIKGVQGAFHSRAAALLDTFVATVLDLADSPAGPAAALILRDCMTLCAGHALAAHTELPVSALLMRLKDAQGTAQLCALLDALTVWTNSRYASRLACPGAIWQQLEQMLRSPDALAPEIVASLVPLLGGIVRSHPSAVPQPSDMLGAICDKSPDAAMTLVGSLLNRASGETVAVIAPYAQRLVRAGLTADVRRATLFLHDLVEAGSMGSVTDRLFAGEAPVATPKTPRRAGRPATPASSTAAMALPPAWNDAIAAGVAQARDDNDFAVQAGFLSCVLACLQSVPVPASTAAEVAPSIARLAKALASSSATDPDALAVLDTSRSLPLRVRIERALLAQCYNVLWALRARGTSIADAPALSLILTHRSDATMLAALNGWHSDGELQLSEVQIAALVQNLVSHEASLRSASLRLLARAAAPIKTVAEIALEMEEIPCTLETYRDKLVRLTRVEPLVTASGADARTVELGVRLLIGNLTLNFRPVWAEFVRVLAALAAAHPDSFWNVFLAVLREMRTAQSSGVRDEPLAAQLEDTSAAARDTSSSRMRVPERPQARKLRYLFSIVDTTLTRHRDEVVTRSERYSNSDALKWALRERVMPPEDALDYHNVELQLWRVLEAAPAVAERFTRHVLPFFYDYMSRVFELDAPADDVKTADADDGSDEDDEDPGETKPDARDEQQDAAESAAETTDNATERSAGRHVILNKALAMLAVIAKLRNPRAAYRADHLQGLLLRLLCSGDDKLQAAALEGLLTWRDPHVMPYDAQLRTLLMERHTRNEVSVLMSILAEANDKADAQDGTSDLAASRRPQRKQQPQQHQQAGQDKKEEDVTASFSLTGLSADDRSSVMPLVLRILFGKMHGRVTRSSRWPPSARRTTIAAFLFSCNDNERALFFALLLRPLLEETAAASLFAAPHFAPSSPSALSASLPLSTNAPASVQRGFLRAFDAVLRHVGSRCTPVLPLFLSVLTHVCLGKASATPIAPQRLRELKQSALRRLAVAVRACPDFDYASHVGTIANEIVAPRLRLFSTEQTQSPAGLMELLLAATTAYNPTCALLADGGALPRDTLSHVVAALSARNVAPTVFSGVLTIVDNVQRLVEDEARELEDAMGDGSAPVRDTVLRPMLPALLVHMQAVLRERLIPMQQGRTHAAAAAVASGTTNKLPGDALPRILALLARVSQHAVDARQARDLVDLLVPLLTLRGSVTERLKASVLSVVARLLPLVPPRPDDWDAEGVPRTLTMLSPLFMTLRENDGRAALCDVMRAIAKHTPALGPIADCVSRLHAMDTQRLDSIDWDARLAAFADADALVDTTSPAALLLPIVHTCAQLLQERDEFSARAHASLCLKRLTARAAAAAPTDTDNAGARRLIIGVVLPATRRALSNPTEAVRQEALALMADMARTLGSTEPRIAPVVHLLLDGAADETSFVDNVYHIQVHRRARAWRRVAAALGNGSVSAAAFQTVVEPLLPYVFIDGGASAIATGNTQGKTQAGAHNVIEEALTVLTAGARVLGWGGYLALFRRFAALVGRHHAREKSLIRAVVAVTAGFHFGAAAEVTAAPVTTEADAPATKPDDDEADADDDAAPDDDATSAAAEELAARIQAGVTKVMLPSLYHLMTEKTGGDPSSGTLVALTGRTDDMRAEAVVRVPVALAVVQLLQALPESLLHKHLPSLLTSLSQLLRARDEGSREVARTTLVKVATQLGPRYLHAVLQELVTALQRGYQRHVLSYTVHAVLAALVPAATAASGSNGASEADGDGADSVPPVRFDGAAIDAAARVFVEELFGETAEEKEIKELASKAKETKTSRGNEGLELLARVVTAEQVPVLLEPVCAVLMRSQSLKLRSRVEDALRHIAMGLATGNGVPDRDLLILAHALLTRRSPLFGLAERFVAQNREVARARAARLEAAAAVESESLALDAPTKKPRAPTAEETFTVQSQGRPDAHHRDLVAHAEENYKAHSVLLVQGGLQVLTAAIRRGRAHGRGDEQLALLDPFVEPLLACLTGRDARLKQLALKALGLLLRLPLPSLDTTQDAYVKVLVKLTVNCGAAGLEDATVQAALKTLALVLRHRPAAALSDTQVQRLLTMLQPTLSSAAHHTTVFSLLRALVDRRRASAALYDAIDAVCHLLVRSELPPIREAARSLVLAFVLDFPMGSARFEALLGHLVSQLGYEYREGRESTLLLISALIDKFPTQVLHERAHFFLLPLVTALLNDDAPSCRQLAAAAARALIARMDDKLRDATVRLAGAWAAPPTMTAAHARAVADAKAHALVRAGIQLFSLMLDAAMADDKPEALSPRPLIAPAIEAIAALSEAGLLPSRGMQGDDEHDTEEEEAPWELAYAVEGLWSRLLRAGAALTLQTASQSLFFGSLWASMRHPHAWVRKAGARRLGLALAAVDMTSLRLANGAESAAGTPTAAKRARRESAAEWSLAPVLAAAIHAAAAQFRGAHIDAEHGDQIVKNLFVLGRAAYAHPEHAASRAAHEEAEGSEDEEDEEAAEMALEEAEERALRRAEAAAAEEELEAGRRKRAFDSDDEDEDDSADADEAALLDSLRAQLRGSCDASPALLRLFRRLCAYARKEGARGTVTTQRMLVFKWMAAIAQALPRDAMAGLLPAAMVPLLRVTSDTTSKFDGFEDLRRLASEVLDHLRRVVGSDAFVKAHDCATRFMAIRRRERRRQAAREAIVNPERAAARRLKRNQSKRMQHKRKVSEHMSHKPSRGVLKARRVDDL